jgi:hypothetical protein
MQTITRKKGAFDDLYFEVDLTGYGKTAEDVADVIFSVKDDLKVADDAIFLKKKSAGEIVVTGTSTVLQIAVSWDYNEYTKLITGKQYNAGVFVKFTGDPAADEHVDQLFKLLIEQDFLRG